MKIGYIKNVHGKMQCIDNDKPSSSCQRVHNGLVIKKIKIKNTVPINKKNGALRHDTVRPLTTRIINTEN